MPLLPLDNPAGVLQLANANKLVTTAYKRINTSGMASAAGASAAVAITAIEPSQEAHYSLIAENISHFFILFPPFLFRFGLT